MVIRGGENVYPREVEVMLRTHPAVAEVKALGVPDPSLWRGALRLGSPAGRFSVERSGSYRLLPGVESPGFDNVSRYVRFVNSFPMTVTGKARKYLMRKAMMEELALVEEKTA